MAMESVQETENYTDVGNATVVLQASEDKSRTLKVVFDVVVTSTLIIIMLGMGATIEVRKLWAHIRRPIAPVIGMFAQFVVLPLLTFGFAHALQLDDYSAIGLLVMGTCPGGSTSNVFTHWADGDVALSLTMTSMASLMALGAMPLNVWIYSRSWTNERLLIPYKNIVLSLALIIVPASVGMFIRYKNERIALRVVKVGSFSGGLAIALLVTLMSILYPFMYKSSWKIYVAAFFYPFIAFAFGYAVAKIFRMNDAHARTVALETGIQNFPLCMTLISLSFPKSFIPKLGLIPLLYGIFCLTNSGLFVLGYHALKRLKQPKADNDDVISDVIDRRKVSVRFNELPCKENDTEMTVMHSDLKDTKKILK